MVVIKGRPSVFSRLNVRFSRVMTLVYTGTDLGKRRPGRSRTKQLCESYSPALLKLSGATRPREPQSPRPGLQWTSCVSGALISLFVSTVLLPLLQLSSTSRLLVDNYGSSWPAPPLLLHTNGGVAWAGAGAGLLADGGDSGRVRHTAGTVVGGVGCG